MKKLLFSFIATVIATTFVCCSVEDYENTNESEIETIAPATRSSINEALPSQPPFPPVDLEQDSILVYPDFSFDTIFYETVYYGYTAIDYYGINLTASCTGSIMFNALQPHASIDLYDPTGCIKEFSPISCMYCVIGETFWAEFYYYVKTKKGMAFYGGNACVTSYNRIKVPNYLKFPHD